MGPKTMQLIGVLDQIIALLETDGEEHWREWMATARSRLLNSDYSGIEYLIGAYGGMGSFNDLIIGQSVVNGEFQWKANAHEANETLNVMRSSAYELADFIKRNREFGET